jgi:hypothetical protein
MSSGALGSKGLTEMKAAHPLVHRRGRQAGGLAQVGVAHPPVGDEKFHDVPVQLLHSR